MNSKVILVTVVMLTLATIVLSQEQQPGANQSNGGMKRGALHDQPIEIGTVRWTRDLNNAMVASRETQKPVLVLFQEVPGCAGCQKFGREVLSNPLLVEAIENEFVPVVVYNNRSSGTDAKLLKQFNEPAWNYQVIRFLDKSGKDIIPRKDHIWTVSAVASRMIETLQTAGRPVPKYLSTLVSPPKPNHQMAAFAMYCFWTGEYELGRIDGVTATEAGWLDGHEVTLVHFDSKKLSLESLARKAAEVRCARKIYTTDGKPISGLRLATGQLDRSYRRASESDQKRQLLRHPRLKEIPNLNATQLTKLNAIVPRNVTQALAWLSPDQRQWLSKN